MKKFLIILVVIIILLFLSFFLYTRKYYKAINVNSYLESNEDVNVRKIDEGYYFDGPGSENCIIFYPGGKVEYTSYATLLFNLSNEGIDTFLLKMPFNLAIFNKNAANNIINKNYKCNNYYLSGHSLGGVVASMYASDNSNDISGLILLASYPTKKISDSNKMLSIYGSNDGVLNLKKYDKSKKYWPSTSMEVVIEGANHSGFGNYGSQKGDNKSNISSSEQQTKTIESIIDFINQ